MYANSPGVEFLRAYPNKEGERKFCRCLFTSSARHEIRHFYVVVAQKRQRNVQKSVMHVQSCCLLIKPIAFYDVLVAVAVVLS